MKKFSQWEMIPVSLFRSEENIKHFQDNATFFSSFLRILSKISHAENCPDSNSETKMFFQ